jgi:hypothetical protein
MKKIEPLSAAVCNGLVPFFFPKVKRGHVTVFFYITYLLTVYNHCCCKNVEENSLSKFLFYIFKSCPLLLYSFSVNNIFH